jgi:4-methylaminobutanoate oxidase (formaldehyde-forming)
MRDQARAVVMGGGVGGCAVLYWLARLGWDDVVLVERADLTSGSTFHSAGLVGHLRSSLSLTRMMMSSVDLYRALEEEVGLEMGWHEVGSLRLASSREFMEEDHYLNYARTEQALFDRTVTDWERSRYLERG